MGLKKISTMISSKYDNESNGEEESGGLLFVDPQEERKAQLEKEKQLKKKEVPMIRLKDGTMIPASAVSAAHSSGKNGPNGQNDPNSRKNYLENLKKQ